MTNKPFKTSDSSKSVILKREIRLPILIILFGGSLFLISLVNVWISTLITIFGLFLLIQSFILKLEFTSDDLIVWQLGKELRRFPFKKWLAWRLFLPSLPGLLYFREEASPHLLPILFNANELETQLRLKLGELERPKKQSSLQSDK